MGTENLEYGQLCWYRENMITDSVWSYQGVVEGGAGKVKLKNLKTKDLLVADGKDVIGPFDRKNDIGRVGDEERHFVQIELSKLEHMSSD